MSTKRCYYEKLEVERAADGSQLKSAFRKLAMKWHPERNPGDQTAEVRFKEINEAYEKNTGLVIIETFENRKINPVYTPAVLCQNHGPFAWGKDAAEAVHNAVVLEEVAKMARLTESVNPDVKPAPDNIKEKHFYRKHGANAYYGQN